MRLLTRSANEKAEVSAKRQCCLLKKVVHLLKLKELVEAALSGFWIDFETSTIVVQYVDAVDDSSDSLPGCGLMKNEVATYDQVFEPDPDSRCAKTDELHEIFSPQSLAHRLVLQLNTIYPFFLGGFSL